MYYNYFKNCFSTHISKDRDGLKAIIIRTLFNACVLNDCVLLCYLLKVLTTPTTTRRTTTTGLYHLSYIIAVVFT